MRPPSQALFREADTDENMVLTKSEVKSRFEGDRDLIDMLQEAGKDVEKFVEDLDADGDGEITLEEFAAIVNYVEPPPVNPDPPVDRSSFKAMRIQDFVAQSVTYNTNDTNEKLVLAYVEDFNKQFTQLYPERRPLLLCPRNECGVRKFVCTTVRPTKLEYKEVYEFHGAAKFVSEYLLHEPLDDPLSHPTTCPSSHSVFKWQRGDSLDFATALCSLLLGVGYDAYIVSGYAPAHICAGDERGLDYSATFGQSPDDEKPDLESLGMSPKAKKDAPLQTRKNPYAYKPPAKLESGYEATQAAKAAAADAAAAAEAAKVAPEAPPPDQYKGMRVHYWVLVRVGKRTVSQPVFVEPVSGRVYPVNESPFLGVESVWNNKNYFVNMQESSLGLTSKFSWKLQNPALWEFVFYDSDGKGGGGFELDGLIAGEPDALGMADGAPDSVAGTEDGAEEGAPAQDHLEVPPSWCRKIEISHDDFNQRALGGEKTRLYSRTKLELFAEYHREDGCTSILTTFEDDACEAMVERRMNFEHRMDRLLERIEYKDGKVHERFLQGHRELTGQTNYGGQATGRITGLKDVIECAEYRQMLFYPSAHKEGLAERMEEWGVKCTEKFVGRDDHLVMRSVCFETEGKSPEQLRELKDRDLTDEDMKIRKMTEKYARNEGKDVAEDVYKKTFMYKDFTIRYDYHHQPGRITRRTRLFSKAEEREVDALGGEPLKVATYDERHKMPKVLEDEMKHCLTLAKDAEVDARAIMEARKKDEADIQLDAEMYDTIRKRIAEGGDEAGQDDKQELLEERDYLKPYLPQGYAPQDFSVRLQKDEAIACKDEALLALKNRLIDKANIIQSRLDDENNLLARKQFGFQRTRDHATAEQEEEYEEFCAEAWFRIQILEQRLARHEDQALQKFAYLDTKLRNDPRLSAIHDYS